MTPVPSALPFATGLPALAFAVSAQDFTAIIIASAALVTAIGTAWVNVMSTREVRVGQRGLKDEVEKNTKITEEVKGKTLVIEGHVNSAASKAAALIASQEIQLAMMKETITKMETAAQLVAQAAAAARPMQPVPQAVTLAPKVGEEATTIRKLEAIEKNTELTAENTARTEESAVRTEGRVEEAINKPKPKP